MRSFRLIIIVLQLCLFASGTIQIIYPVESCSIVPGIVKIQFLDDANPPRIQELGASFTATFFTGGNDQPISMAYSGSWNFSTQSGVGVTQSYKFEMDNMMFNGTDVFFLAITALSKNNPKLQMTTYSSRFSLANMVGTPSPVAIDANSKAQGSPTPGRVFRCNFPALEPCSPDAALAAFAAATSGTALPSLTVSGSPSETGEPDTSMGKGEYPNRMNLLAGGLAGVALFLMVVGVCFFRRKKRECRSNSWWKGKEQLSPNNLPELSGSAGPYLTTELPAPSQEYQGMGNNGSFMGETHERTFLEDARIIDVLDVFAVQDELNTASTSTNPMKHDGEDEVAHKTHAVELDAEVKAGSH